MALAVLNPIPQFFDLDGAPLDCGRLYFGDVAQNPVTNPTTVYWDAAATIPAAQPVHTKNGYPVRNGTPAAVYASGNVSLLVQTRTGVQVFYGADSADFGNAESLQAQIDAVVGDVAALLGEYALVAGQEFTGPIYYKGPEYLSNGRAPYNTGYGVDTLASNQYLPGQFPASGGIFFAGGDYNTAIGAEALKANTEGRRNTAVGAVTLVSNTTGYYNTAVGAWAMHSNTTGFDNTAVGVQSLQFNDTGNYNTALGLSALNRNTSGSNNVALGHLALSQNTTGISNVAVGRRANWLNTTGVSNVVMGNDVFSQNVSGSYNVAIGDAALGNSVSANNNVAIGRRSMLVTTGAENVGVGTDTLVSNTTGTWNTAVGQAALASVVSGQRNVAIGRRALTANTTDNLTAVGTDALVSNTTGGSNVAVGYSALGSNTTGALNVAVGNLALSSNTTGSANTAVGRSAAVATQGANNTALGDQALADNTSGNNNTAIGAASLPTQTNLSNCTGLGYQATCVASNQITLGNSSISSLRCQVTTITALSDARDKAERRAFGFGLGLINAIEIDEWTWDQRDGSARNGSRDFGVIAQQLLEVQERFGASWLGLVDASNADRLEATPGKLLFPLIKAVQELSAKVDQLQQAA